MATAERDDQDQDTLDLDGKEMDVLWERLERMTSGDRRRTLHRLSELVNTGGGLQSN